MSDFLLRALPILILCCVLVAVLPASRAALRRQLALFGLLATPMVLTLGLIAQHADWRLDLPWPDGFTQAEPSPGSIATAPPATPFRLAAIGENAGQAAAPANVSNGFAVVGSAFVGIAILGALVGIAILIRRWFGLKRLHQQARFAHPGQSGSGRLSIGYHPALTTPICFGWQQPVILLPDAAEDWSPLQLEQALSHEMAHIRHGDWWQQQLVEVLTRLSWWNPLCWYLRRCFLRDIEILADAHVIQTTRQPAAYARHLLALASPFHPVQAGATGMGLQPPFAQRLQTLIDQTEVHTMNRFQSMTLTVLAACLIIPLSISHAHNSAPSSPTTPPSPPHAPTAAPAAEPAAPAPPVPGREMAVEIKRDVEAAIEEASHQIRAYKASGEIEEEVRRAVEQLHRSLEKLEGAELADVHIQLQEMGLAESDASEREIELAVEAVRQSIEDIDTEQMIVRIHRDIDQKHTEIAGQHHEMTIEAHERAIAGLERALEEQRAALQEARAMAESQPQ